MLGSSCFEKCSDRCLSRNDWLMRAGAMSLKGRCPDVASRAPHGHAIAMTAEPEGVRR